MKILLSVSKNLAISVRLERRIVGVPLRLNEGLDKARGVFVGVGLLPRKQQDFQASGGLGAEREAAAR